MFPSLIHRREALATGIAAVAGAYSPFAFAKQKSGTQFKLKYAPHFGMFKHSAGKDEVDQLKFARDEGFVAWEDNGMKARPVETQERIAATMQKLGMEMGVISATRGAGPKVSFAGDDAAAREKILSTIKGAVDSAKRVNATWMTVILGDVDPKLPLDYQTANAIELLRRCCDVLEPHGLVMVLEPLNHLTNHPGKFLHRSPQAYMICEAVDSPACKILFDIYHQQISEGNLIPNIDRCWDQIGYFQCGDNPGRKEPGTGEINYQNVFGHLYERQWQGIVGMEHGNHGKGIEGERALIEAYRQVDQF